MEGFPPPIETKKLEEEASSVDLFEQAQAMEAGQKAKFVEQKLKLSDTVTYEDILKERAENVAKGEQEIKLDDASEKKIEQEAEEIKKELEEMPAEKLEEIGVGFRNFGFFAKEYKNKVMAGIFENVSGDKKEAQEAKGFIGSIKRWAQGFSLSYRKDEATARKNIEEAAKSGTALKQVGNVGFVAGETMKHGRTVADVLGWTAGSPLRYAMFGAQIFSRGAEAAKEARLMNTEVLEKTRIQDMDEAAEEAWKIYENTQVKGGKVSKEDLEKSYVENLPADLLKRLEKSEPGMATGILQKVLKKDLEFAIRHGKIKIGEDGKVEKLFENSFNDRLKEYDRLVSQYGTVDALAMGAKYAETAGKAVIAAVSIETAALGVRALWNHFPDIMGRLAKNAGGASEKLETLSGLSEEDILHRGLGLATEAKPSLGVHNVVEIEKPAVSPVSEKLGDLSESAIVQKGEGVEHAFIRQLSEDPEKFGFKGDAADDNAVMDWAGKEAHRVAIKAGYVDMGTGNEIRIGGKGGAVAYELEKDSAGNIKVNEYSKDDKGIFQGEEINEAAKDFKSAQFEIEKESYEYEHEKPAEQEIVPETPNPSVKGSAKIDEHYDQRIADQERLKGIKSVEMMDKSEYYDQRIAEQETNKDIARAVKSGAIENTQNILKNFDSAERANVGKMTIGKLLAETTADKIDKVQAYGSTEGIIDLPPARAQLSEVEYHKYAQLSEQIRGAKPNTQEMKMMVDEFLKPRKF